MSSCFSRCLRVPIAIRAFYESYLWILQTLLLTHPDLHPGLLGMESLLRNEPLFQIRNKSASRQYLTPQTDSVDNWSLPHKFTGEHAKSLPIPLRMRRPAGAREALGLIPLKSAGGAHSSGIESVPFMSAVQDQRSSSRGDQL